MKKNLPLSYIEISKKNLIYNIKEFQKFVNNKTKIVVAIKGNAYGHGQNEVAKILNSYVDYFFVNSILELFSLRKITKKKTFVLGFVDNLDLKKVIKLNSILAVFSIKQIKKINEIAKKERIIQEIHLPVDAFLGREGFLFKDLDKVFKEIKKSKNIKLGGIYAHFSNIEDTTNFSYAQKQINEYKRILAKAKEFNFKNLKTHISATSGLLVYEKNLHKNSLVRLGIGIYGIWPSKEIQKKCKNKLNLKPVLSFKTKVAQIKILPKGSSIGYGLTFKTKKKTKTAIIPLGYADGLDRKLSNKGNVLIRGKKCKILGRVSMNMIVVDVTQVKNIKIEDKVIIIGKQGKQKITLEDIAKQTDTINYEVCTRLSSILPRVIK